MPICPYCLLMLDSRTEVEQHIVMSHLSMATASPMPQQSVNHRSSVSSNSSPQHICKLCGSSFTRKPSLTRHLKTVHNKKYFKCPYCTHQTARCDNLKQHIEILHPNMLAQGTAAQTLVQLMQWAVPPIPPNTSTIPVFPGFLDQPNLPSAPPMASGTYLPNMNNNAGMPPPDIPSTSLPVPKHPSSSSTIDEILNAPLTQDIADMPSASSPALHPLTIEEILNMPLQPSPPDQPSNRQNEDLLPEFYTCPRCQTAGLTKETLYNHPCYLR